MRSDRFDIALHDAELLAEIELLAELMLACSASPGRLAGATLDTLLGLPHAQPA